MARSKFKGLYIKPINVKNTKTKIKIFDKNIKILPDYIDQVFLINNGKTFFPLKVKEGMVGFNFGNFVFTRAIYKYKK